METVKQLMAVGVLGLIVGGVAYIFMQIQSRSESREKIKWEQENANLSPADLSTARKAKFDRRIFPGISNNLLIILLIVVVLVFLLAEFDFFN